MIEIVHEFVVKEEARGQFELAFGPGGAWSDLFARWPGFRGTTLLRHTEDPQRYLTVDLWDTVGQRQQVLDEHRAEWSSLQDMLGEWTDSDKELGAFRVVAEATVRPHDRARRSRGGPARRRSDRTTR